MINIKKYFSKIFTVFSFILLLYSIAPAQNYLLNIPADSAANIDNLSLRQSSYVVKATRFLPVIFKDGFSDFSSPDYSPILVGMKFSTFPLNYASPDLVPFDREEIIANCHNSRGARTGAELLKGKPAKRTGNNLFFKAYFGSETGDPTIHLFTRQSLTAMNKNKIPYSGQIGYAERGEKINYKITAGYFGAYSTGSVTDRMLSAFDNYYFGKLNKQFLGTGELNVLLSGGKELSVHAGIISYYGWDISPFLSCFSHFEILNNTFRGSLKNIFDGFSISFRRDEGIGKINKTSITPTSEFSMSEIALRPSFELEEVKSGSAELLTEIFAEAEFISNSNFDLDESIIHQDFFDEEVSKMNYKIGGEFQFLNFPASPILLVEYSKHFSGGNGISACIDLSIIQGLTASASSLIRYPNGTELYGSYLITRKTNNNTERFVKSGSPNLVYERQNKAAVQYIFEKEKFNWRGSFYFTSIQNPIKQTADNLKRYFFEYDIIGNSSYINSTNKSGVGFEMLSKICGGSWSNFIFDYEYLENKDAAYLPKHKLNLKLELLTKHNVKFTFNWLYQSRTTWQSYIVEKADDFFNGQGFGGKLNEINSFNIYIDYTILDFYFLKGAAMRISIENIFNREMRYHPLGNKFDRAFIFSLSGNL